MVVDREQGLGVARAGRPHSNAADVGLRWGVEPCPSQLPNYHVFEVASMTRELVSESGLASSVKCRLQASGSDARSVRFPKSS
jgi:hypothetical protein